MTKKGATAKKPAIDERLSPPRYLSRAEKSAFHRLVVARNRTNRPVLATEIDLVADYVCARSRIVRLRQLLEREMAKASTMSWVANDLFGLARQIDATTRFALTLARKLRLFDNDD